MSAVSLVLVVVASLAIVLLGLVVLLRLVCIFSPKTNQLLEEKEQQLREKIASDMASIRLLLMDPHIPSTAMGAATA
eukprot:scaffold10347_cov96-Skeletonema_marinoi.AAC.1